MQSHSHKELFYTSCISNHNTKFKPNSNQGVPRVPVVFSCATVRNTLLCVGGQRLQAWAANPPRKNLWCRVVSFTILIDFWSIYWSGLYLNQWQWASPTLITWTDTWRHDTFEWHDRSGLAWLHSFCRNNKYMYVILPWKMFLIRLLCHLFDTNVVCNGGYYSLVSENAQKQYFSLSRTTICLSCRILMDQKKLEAIVKEVANITWDYEKKSCLLERRS